MNRNAFLLITLSLIFSSLLYTGCEQETITKSTIQTESDGKVEITITTRNFPGTYSAYVLATWIEDGTGEFVKTVNAYGNYTAAEPKGATAGYLPALIDWIAAGGEVGPTANIDGWSGASRTVHGAITSDWDLKDRAADARVDDGAYVIQVECTKENAHLTHLTSTTKNAELPITVGGTASANFSMTSEFIDISAV